MPDLTAAGGWCAPSETVYDLWPDLDWPNRYISMPEVSVSRDWIPFPKEGTVEWQRQKVLRDNRERMEALIARKIGDIRRAQVEVENWAVLYALRNDYTVTIHTNWDSRFVGIGFNPGQPGDLLVTHYHQEDRYDW
jgi:hypothetical protein